MLMAVTITVLILLSYIVMFDSIAVATVSPARYQELKSNLRDDYPVLVGSAIESQFMSLEVYNCSSEVAKPLEIWWNNEYWQAVDNRKVFLYSAFYDRRFVYLKVQYHYVRIIGMSVNKIGKEPYYCTLWYDNFPKAITVKADATEIWLQHWNRNPQPNTHHAYLFTCPIPLEIRDKGTYPHFVSLSSQKCTDLTTLLPVKKEGLNSWQNGSRQNYAVCVKGMDFVKDLSIRLIEWLELLFILGADKVFFYKYRIHENMEKVLDYYEKQGRVSVVPLTLPGDQPNDPKARSSYLKRAVWQKRRNEIVPYNDCLYKNMYLFEYIIPLDIDEVIMPVKRYTWTKMLSDYRKESPQVFKKTSSFSAQNTYFLDVYNSTYNPDVPSYYHMLQSRIRSANFSLYGHSVKSFVSTSLSKTVFNHYTLESLYYSVKKTNHVMNTSHVQLNHYKERCPRDIYSQCQSKFLVYTKIDRTIDKYQKSLFYHVESVLKKLKLSVK